MKTRNELVDQLKGFAILLVVIGHSVQYSVPAFDQNWLFRIIYSFHMPLFMFLSGYVALSSFDGSVLSLNKRFKSLIIPFFAWFLITDLLAIVLQYFGLKSPMISYHSTIQILQSPTNGGLWFLWELFQNFLILFLVKRIAKKRTAIVLLIVAIGLSILGEYINESIPYFDIQFAGWNLFFFALGYFLGQYEQQWSRFTERFGFLFLALFVLFVSVWMRHKTPKVIFELPLQLRTFGYYFYRYATPLFGIISSFYLLKMCSLIRPIKTSLIFLGAVSLGIYAVHFYFVALAEALFPVSGYFKIFIVAAFALFTTIVAIYLMKRDKWLGFLLLGKPLNK